MIDDFTADRTGWARFSDDRTLRYRLARALTPQGARSMAAGAPFATLDDDLFPLRRIVFVMLNPSTADAFKLDNTVTKCVQFAQRWQGDILEVVNLFALRSTDPKGLDVLHIDDIGDGPENDSEIVSACLGASRVIAAWGNHAWRGDRGERVRELLVGRGLEIEHLGVTKEGFPLHPLARGKAFIPLDRKPEVWT